ncbi:MAG: branched-chain amino acid aminotransferase [Alphaproteobacteria bacterium]
MSLLPFDDRDGYIWYNGTMLPWRDAKFHVLSHGLHYASGVFEGQRAYNGEIFKLAEHTSRLFNSARILDFEIPYTEDEINKACADVMRVNDLPDGYSRPIAWRGPEMMGVSAQETKIHVAIAGWEWPSYFDPELREKGIRLDVSEWKRPAPDCAPTQAKAAGLYMICTLSKHTAERKGYQDSLMFDYRGQVAEATGANIFFLQDGVLHTPIPDCFLDGITRRTVMDLARQRGIEIVERVIMPDEMEGFEQCFLTGTAAEVTAVGEIGPYSFEVGEVTKVLRADYEKLVRGNR